MPSPKQPPPGGMQPPLPRATPRPPRHAGYKPASSEGSRRRSERWGEHKSHRVFFRTYNLDLIEPRLINRCRGSYSFVGSKRFLGSGHEKTRATRRRNKIWKLPHSTYYTYVPWGKLFFVSAGMKKTGEQIVGGTKGGNWVFLQPLVNCSGFAQKQRFFVTFFLRQDTCVRLRLDAVVPSSARGRRSRVSHHRSAVNGCMAYR